MSRSQRNLGPSAPLRAIAPVLGFALVLGTAQAEPPTLTFDPAPLPAASGTIALSGTAQSTLTVQPVAPAICEAPIGPEVEATLTCVQEGAGNFLPASVGMLFTCNVLQAQAIALTCTPQDAALTSSTLTCTEKSNGPNNNRQSIYTLQCPPSQPAQPDIDTTPAAGQGLSMSSDQPADAIALVTVANAGLAALTVTGVQGLAAPFGVSAGVAFLFALQPGQSRVLSVICPGASEGQFADADGFSILSDDPDEGTLAFASVACTVRGPEVEPSPPPPTPIVLSAVVNVPQATQQLTLANVGSATLELGQPTGLTGRLGATLDLIAVPPGAVANLTVTCTTSTEGTSGPQNLTVTTDDPDGGEATLIWPVTCTVLPANAPEFDAAPAPGPIDLATTAGGAPATRMLTFTNNGNAQLSITAISNLAAPLSRSPTGPTLSIAPAASAMLQVSCGSATAAGTSQTLGFTTNDPDDGEASIAYPISCAVAAAPAPEFGSTPAAPGPIVLSTPVGTSQNGSATLANAGTANLTLAVLTPPTAPVAIVTSPASPVAPGASTSVTVSCTPTSQAVLTRNVVLDTNDTDEDPVTLQVSCRGTAGEFEFVAVPANPLLLVTDQGVQTSTVVAIRNTGDADLTLTASVGPVNVYAVAPSVQQTVAPGATRSFTLSCLSAAAGTFDGTLQLGTNDPDDGEALVSVPLRCQANVVAPEFDSTPAPNNTVRVYVTPGSPASAVIALRNLGNAPLNYVLGGLSGVFSSTPGIGGSNVLAPGATELVVVQCAGLVSGTALQIFTVNSNDANESFAQFFMFCEFDVRNNALPTIRSLLVSDILLPQTILSDALFKNDFEDP